MIRSFFINLFFVFVAIVIGQDLYATRGKKKNKSLVVMNKNSEAPKQNDDHCEGMCMLVPGLACGVCAMYVSLATETYLVDARTPSGAISNLWQDSIGGAGIGMLVGRLGYACYSCCQSRQKIKQD